MVTINDPDSLLSEPLELPGGNQPPKRPGSRPDRSFIRKGLIGLIIMLVVGGGGYSLWRFAIKSKPKTNSSTTPSNAQQTTPSGPSDVTATADLKTYKSDELSFQISYPASWEVTEKDGVRITSPDFTYQTIDKGSVKGNFLVYIRRSARTVDGKYIGAAVAVRPSEQLNYSQPGTGQRKTTSLTQFGAGTSDHFTFFMVTSDFNLQKDQTLGPNYGREPGTYILVGGYGVKSQVDDLNFNNVPLTNFDKEQVYSQAVTIIKSFQLL